MVGWVHASLGVLEYQQAQDSHFIGIESIIGPNMETNFGFKVSGREHLSFKPTNSMKVRNLFRRFQYVFKFTLSRQIKAERFLFSGHGPEQ